MALQKTCRHRVWKHCETLVFSCYFSSSKYFFSYRSLVVREQFPFEESNRPAYRHPVSLTRFNPHIKDFKTNKQRKQQEKKPQQQMNYVVLKIICEMNLLYQQITVNFILLFFSKKSWNF